MQRQDEQAAAPYGAHPAVLGDCVARLRQAYWAMSTVALVDLRGRKTVAVGAVVDQDQPDVTVLPLGGQRKLDEPRTCHGPGVARGAAMGRRLRAHAARQPRSRPAALLATRSSE